MQRSFSVNYSSPEGRFAQKYPSLAHLPYVLDSRPGFHRMGNSYLVERGLGLWSSGSSGRNTYSKIPTKQTMHNYAQWLSNFLEWLDVRGVDAVTCSYPVHVAGRYQSEMLEGIWSYDGRKLKATTVNLRVQQACDFLTWMVDRGKRGPFGVPYETYQVKVGGATSSLGHLSREVRSRTGKARSVQGALLTPTEN
jgi:hypothetical protein